MQFRCVKAQRTLGTGIDVFCEIKRIVTASVKSTSFPNLTQIRFVNMRTLPSKGRIFRRVAIANRMKCLYKAQSLIGPSFGASGILSMQIGEKPRLADWMVTVWIRLWLSGELRKADWKALNT